MRFIVVLIYICVSLSALETYKFGVFPHMPLKKLHEVYSPIAKDLEEHVDKHIVLMTKPYYKLYKAELNEGYYDIAFIQPFDYIEAREKQGYIPIAARAEELSAIMVVSKASTYKTIADIEDKIIASAPAEAAVTKMMLSDLSKQGHRPLDDFTISYSKNHFICLQKVVDGEAVACITASRAVKYFNQEKGMDNFRVVYSTQKLPHALFVVHPRVSQKIREKFQKRILLWDKEEKTRAMLQKGMLLNFKKTTDADYDRIREFIKVKG